MTHNENFRVGILKHGGVETGRKASTRFLFDRNAWSYLADAGAGPDLLRRALRSGADILVAPTVVFETLAIKDEETRRRHLSLITLPRWHRLMPDAYSECLELVKEIRRLRPDWLRADADFQRLRFQRHDWTRKKGGFWEAARDNPKKLAMELGITEGWQRRLKDLAGQEAKERGDRFKEDITLSNWRLRVVMGIPNVPVPGWDGQPVQAWRFASWSEMSGALALPNHPYRDWLSPDIELDQITGASEFWGRFWLRDVDEQAMPRFWLRWAFHWLQGFQKYTPGTPADASLATYLPECDVFVSADKNIVRNVIACQADSLCRVPKAVRIPGGPDGAEAILKLVDSR